MKKKIWFFAAAACIAAAAAAVTVRKHRTKSQEEEVPTCGGCFNNCYLTAPGCRIGREKAEEYFSGRQQ